MTDRRPNLKAWRDHRFLSQVGLAEKAGMSERAIVRLEKPNGPRPRVSTLHKLSKALGISPDRLYDEPQRGD